MKVAENMYVTLSYTLTVDGAVVESVTADKPLGFIYGTGNLLPAFEQNLTDLAVGDTFAFTLTPENAYGELIADAVVTLPKNIFEVDGKVDEDMVKEGNLLPMMDNQGNRLNGLVKSVTAEEVVMDFNHPMAGKTLNFEGAVVEVRVPSAEELAGAMGSCGCGCGSEGCGDGEECGCESKDSCSSCGCE